MRIGFNISYNQEASILLGIGLYSTMDPKEYVNEHLTSVVAFSNGRDCQRREKRKEAKGLSRHTGDKSIPKRKRKISPRG